jgi:cephalosporin hydroxylase
MAPGDDASVNSHDHSLTNAEDTTWERKSSLNPAIHEQKKEELKEITDIARQDTRNVWFWKLAVLCLILLMAAVVSAGTYIFAKENQENDFIDAVCTQLFIAAMMATESDPGKTILFPSHFELSFCFCFL